MQNQQRSEFSLEAEAVAVYITNDKAKNIQAREEAEERAVKLLLDKIKNLISISAEQLDFNKKKQTFKAAINFNFVEREASTRIIQRLERDLLQQKFILQDLQKKHSKEINELKKMSFKDRLKFLLKGRFE